jgi:hypothetical protein
VAHVGSAGDGLGTCVVRGCDEPWEETDGASSGWSSAGALSGDFLARTMRGGELDLRSVPLAVSTH